MEISKQESDKWRAKIIRDATQAQRDLDALDREDHGKFVAICLYLAADPAEAVQRVALRKLGQRGNRDDDLAEMSALSVLGVPGLRHTALFALGRVGTPRAFPILLAEARQGSSIALAAASDQVRTDQEAQQLLLLARKYIMVPGSKGHRLREESLRILLRYSSAEAEQSTLLSSARLYADDFVIVALAEASVAIVGDLIAIQRNYPPDSVEYKSLSYTIDRLEQRKSGLL